MMQPEPTGQAWSCIFCDAAVQPAHVRCSKCGRSLLLNQRYRLQQRLGEGGAGVVHAAIDTVMQNRLCAIKRVVAGTDHEIQFFIEQAGRFAFIPHAYDRWSEPPVYFSVMEYI